jgi:PAS domain S-box-containing protein
MREQQDDRSKKQEETHAQDESAREPHAAAANDSGVSPAHFTDLIERISDGFVALDAKMNYTYVNQRGGELLGRKPEELIGRNYWEEYPEAHGTPFANAYVRAIETQTSVLIEDYYAPWDRWFENRIYPSNDGITILFTEITDRRKAEEEAREQNRLISALAETIPGFLYVYDLEKGKNVYSNKGTEHLLGYTVEEVESMGTELFNRLLHPDDNESVMASQDRLATTKDAGVGEVDYRMRHAGGEWRWIRSYERPFTRHADGSLRQKIGIAIDITARKLAEEQNQRQLKRLRALRLIDVAISSSFDLNVVLDLVLQHLLLQLGVEAGAVLLVKSHLQTVEYVASQGFQSSSRPRTRSKLSERYADQVVAERRAIHLTDLTRTDEQLPQLQQMIVEGFVDYYGTPLIVKGEVKGVLEIYNRSPLNLNTEQLDFFETLAGQSAIAIDNTQLFNSLQRAHSDLIMAYDATITGWSRAMDLRDRESQGHAQRVTDLSLSMAKEMKIPEAQLIHLRRGALLHDIGKIGVPDHILLKSTPLTAEEEKQMQKHPEFALELLSPIGYLQPALEIPYCHHEKWDGTGYPRRLKTEQIPLSARIFSIVDAWDNLIHGRPYQSAISREQALECIRSESGQSFDPEIVEVFLTVMDNEN